MKKIKIKNASHYRLLMRHVRECEIHSNGIFNCGITDCYDCYLKELGAGKCPFTVNSYYFDLYNKRYGIDFVFIKSMLPDNFKKYVYTENTINYTESEIEQLHESILYKLGVNNDLSFIPFIN